MRKVFLVVFGLFFTVGLFGQVTVEYEKPFTEKLSDYYRDCNLHESTILKLFENQIWLDYDIDFEFREGEVMRIVNGEVVLPPSFQKSILKVIDSPENYDNREGNYIKG